MVKRFSGLILLALFSTLASPVHAQTATPPAGPIYVVQEGDMLYTIANLFRVDPNELIAINNITNPDFLSPGDELIIPGLEDLSGYLVVTPVPFGESLRSMSRRSGSSEALIQRLNRLVSPTELYAGVRLILLKQDENSDLKSRSAMAPGGTLLEMAVSQGTDTWTIAGLNQLQGTWAAQPGDVLYFPKGESQAGPTGLPAVFRNAEISPLPVVQGKTIEVKVQTSSPVSSLNGLLVDHPLHFFETEANNWVALQGVHALTDPGIYPVRLEATLPDGSKQAYEQMILVEDGYYVRETLVVDKEYIDPAVTEPEAAQILALIAPVTPTRFWTEKFIPPGYFPDCYNSRFGNRRTFITPDGSLTLYGFHTGLDFCGGSGLPIYAPAPGVVIFAGSLTVRGNATIIDHGWGIYSGIWHQSEISVQVGQEVKAGDIIGKVGGTGRVTGDHLHWEIWVNGVQVDPIDWLAALFPH
jgi:murein DD-endopeptidase MepM/ murein hydrolase activator NlpD